MQIQQGGAPPQAKAFYDYISTPAAQEITTRKYAVGEDEAAGYPDFGV
ncbi:hypothetical protein AB4Z48_37795 [Cupriavidus sp. 2TAF22]